MRRVSLLFPCSVSAFSLLSPRVSVSSLSHLSLIIRARKVKFCEVLKTDLFFSFSVSQISSFLKFSNAWFCLFFLLKSKVLTGSQMLGFVGFPVRAYTREFERFSTIRQSDKQTADAPNV